MTNTKWRGIYFSLDKSKFDTMFLNEKKLYPKINFFYLFKYYLEKYQQRRILKNWDFFFKSNKDKKIDFFIEYDK